MTQLQPEFQKKKRKTNKTEGVGMDFTVKIQLGNGVPFAL